MTETPSVDEIKEVPQKYQDLIWFLFPQKVADELSSLKAKNITYTKLKTLSQKYMDLEFNMPFRPIGHKITP